MLVRFFLNKTLMKNFVSVLSIDVLVKASGVFLLPVYLTLMTQAEFGLYSYGVGVTSLFISIGGMGLYGALNRFFYDKRFKKNEIISTLFSLLLLSILVLIFVLLLTLNEWNDFVFEREIESDILMLIVIASLHGVLIQFLMGLLYIDKNYSQIRKINLTRLIVVNAFVLSVMYFFAQDSVAERLISLIVVEVFVFVLFSQNITRYFSVDCIDINLIKLSIFFGFPLVLNSIVAFVYSFSDKYFIQSNFDFSNVGGYVFIFTVASVYGLFFSTVQNFWLPYFFDPDNKESITRKLIFLIFGLFLLSAIYYLFAHLILKIVFSLDLIDKSYLSGVNYLWLLVLAQFFSAVRSLFSNFYSLYDKNIYGVYVSLIMAFLGVTIMYYFVEGYGEYGAATGALINAILGSMLTIMLVKTMEKKCFA